MRSWYTRILLALIFLALVVNLATGGEITKEGQWEWILAGGGALFSLVVFSYGILLTTKLRAKRERSSLLWARRGFAAGLVIALLLAADVFLGVGEKWLVREMWQGAALMIGLTTSPFFFLIAYRREFVRTQAHTSSSGRSRRSSE